MKIVNKNTQLAYTDYVDISCFGTNTILATPKQGPTSNEPPSGFVYIQLPEKAAPTELWPNTEWENISSCFAGAFFRAEGGNASSFESGQQGFGTSLSGLSLSLASNSWSHGHTGAEAQDVANAAEVKVCSGSTGVCCVAICTLPTTSSCSGIHCHSITLTSADTETRPINYTVRAWRKI